MNSAIYEGRLSHRRMQPVAHAFDYRLFMLYLDLSELDQVFRERWLWSVGGFGLARFRRADHLGDPELSLDRSVRDLVERETGSRPGGPITLLTHLEYFGYRFNPVSFYYCFDSSGQRVETIVAEVNNTPWGEQHCYVLPVSPQRGGDRVMRFTPRKAMHVSPFMEMDVAYEWAFSRPGEVLHVSMKLKHEGRMKFDAALVLERREISARSLAGVLLDYPPMTLKIIIAIYWQALRLWLKGCPVIDHPGSPKGRRSGRAATTSME